MAVRLWAPLWKRQRVRLFLRSDNIGALTVFSALKSAGVAGNLIAREYALDVGKSEYEPELIQHIAGVTNVIADLLSRRTDPQKSDGWTVTAFLAHAKQWVPPPRVRSWWKTLATPGVAS